MFFLRKNNFLKGGTIRKGYKKKEYIIGITKKIYFYLAIIFIEINFLNVFYLIFQTKILCIIFFII